MPVLASSLLTLVDWAKRVDPNGRIDKVAELLSQTNEILTDMPFMEGNLPTGHRASLRTGLPAPTWRLLNKGVPVTKSTTAQIDEACGILEDRSQIDQDLAMLNGNTPEFRLSEARAHIEGMNQEMASTLFYGNSGVSAEEITGLSPRYSSLSANNAQNIVDAGGTGSDNSSIWLVVWSDMSVYGIFPKGSKAGLIHEDLGLGDAFDSSNNRFRAYMDRWQWKAGICLKDWRYVVRVANIDISNLVAKSSAADIIELMIKAIHRLPNSYSGLGVGRPVFYMNRTVSQMLDIFRRDDVITGGGLTYEVVDGKRLNSFRGIPIRTVDALVQNEARVT